MASVSAQASSCAIAYFASIMGAICGESSFMAPHFDADLKESFLRLAEHPNTELEMGINLVIEEMFENGEIESLDRGPNNPHIILKLVFGKQNEAYGEEIFRKSLFRILNIDEEEWDRLSKICFNPARKNFLVYLEENEDQFTVCFIDPQTMFGVKVCQDVDGFKLCTHSLYNEYLTSTQHGQAN